MQNYIAGLLEVPTGVTDLADLIAFNSAHPDLELVAPFYTSQSECVIPPSSLSTVSARPRDVQVRRGREHDRRRRLLRRARGGPRARAHARHRRGAEEVRPGRYHPAHRRCVLS